MCYGLTPWLCHGSGTARHSAHPTMQDAKPNIQRPVGAKGHMSWSFFAPGKSGQENSDFFTL